MQCTAYIGIAFFRILPVPAKEDCGWKFASCMENKGLIENSICLKIEKGKWFEGTGMLSIVLLQLLSANTSGRPTGGGLIKLRSEARHEERVGGRQGHGRCIPLMVDLWPWPPEGMAGGEIAPFGHTYLWKVTLIRSSSSWDNIHTLYFTNPFRMVFHSVLECSPGLCFLSASICSMQWSE